MELRRIQSGMTLVELMATVSVVAILATVAVPSFQSQLARNRLKGAAENLFADLQLARQEAIKRNTPVSLVFKNLGTANWCYGLDDHDTCDCEAAAGSPDHCQIGETDGIAGNEFHRIARASELAGTVTLSGGFGGNVTGFDPVRGTATSGTMNFASGGDSISVIVSGIGRVRLCSPSVAGYGRCNR